MKSIIGLMIVSAMAATAKVGSDGSAVTRADPRAHLDVPALLTAARGAPPLICSLAAQSLRGYGWGDGVDAPYTPLAGIDVSNDGNDAPRGERSNSLSDADVAKLTESLSSSDDCVRELAVRLIGRESPSRVGDALVMRLGSDLPSLRSVAAFGLGLIRSQSAVDPLVHALRDTAASVRGNSVWALGKLESGRALAPIVAMFSDREPLVREASVVAVGRLDSASSTAALSRVLAHDDNARVRRSAAWALGQLDAHESVDVLATALARDADPAVREMAAWALGNVEGRSGAAALRAALRGDASDRVRETAAWALAELEDHASVDMLSTAVESDASVRVRGTAAWALGELRDEDGHAPRGLIHLLKADSDDARLKAAWALGQIGDSTTLGAIREALRAEKSSPVRRALIRALLKSGGRDEATLTELISSNDPAVREAAVRGLAGRESNDPWPWPWPRPRPFP